MIVCGVAVCAATAEETIAAVTVPRGHKIATHPIAKGETVEMEVYWGAPAGAPQIQSLRATVQVWPTKKLDEEPVAVTSNSFRVSQPPQ